MYVRVLSSSLLPILDHAPVFSEKGTSPCRVTTLSVLRGKMEESEIKCCVHTQIDLHQREDHFVKFFRSDGGTEFTNKTVDELLAKHGIVR